MRITVLFVCKWSKELCIIEIEENVCVTDIKNLEISITCHCLFCKPVSRILRYRCANIRFKLLVFQLPLPKVISHHNCLAFQLTFLMISNLQFVTKLTSQD